MHLAISVNCVVSGISLDDNAYSANSFDRSGSNHNQGMNYGYGDGYEYGDKYGGGTGDTFGAGTGSGYGAAGRAVNGFSCEWGCD